MSLTTDCDTDTAAGRIGGSEHPNLGCLTLSVFSSCLALSISTHMKELLIGPALAEPVLVNAVVIPI